MRAPRLIATVLMALSLAGCAAHSARYDAWTDAHQAAGRLDGLTEPGLAGDYYRRVDLGPLTIHLCGPDTLRRLSPSGGQCALGSGRDGSGQVWVLAGSDYLSQHGLGHEMGHLLGYQVDTLVQD